MRQLHVVSLSEDGRSVLLATSKSAKAGAFSVPLEGKLAAAVRGDLPRAGEQQARDIGVSPKEIQARLRAGESVEQIANAAGVPIQRVERFAGPVLSERERVIEEARAGFVSRNRRGASLLPLGDAVDAALAETSGLRPESVTWTARRLESGHWLVQISYVARARTRTASWVYEPHTRAITASDSASAAMGHVGDEPGPRRLAAVAPRPAARPATAKPAARKPAKKKAAKKKAVRKAVAKAAPRPVAKAAPKPVAKKAAAKKAVAKTAAKTAAKKPATKPATKKVATKAPAKKAVAKPAPKRAAPKPAARTAAPARKGPSRKLRQSAAAHSVADIPVVQWGPPVDTPPTLRVVPQPAAEPEPETAHAPDAPASEPDPQPAPRKRRAGERAHVPDWADVLLGTAPKRSDD